MIHDKYRIIYDVYDIWATIVTPDGNFCTQSVIILLKKIHECSVHSHFLEKKPVSFSLSCVFLFWAISNLPIVNGHVWLICPGTPPISPPHPLTASFLLGVVFAKCDSQFTNLNIVEDYLGSGDNNLELQLIIRAEILCALSKKIMVGCSVIFTWRKDPVTPRLCWAWAPIINPGTNESSVQDFCATSESLIFLAFCWLELEKHAVITAAPLIFAHSSYNFIHSKTWWDRKLHITILIPPDIQQFST